MKFKKRQFTWVEVEYELPYYYVMYFDNSSCYGRIDEKETMEITIDDTDEQVEFDIEPTAVDDTSCFDPKYKSTKTSFMRAYRRALRIIGQFDEEGTKDKSIPSKAN